MRRPRKPVPAAINRLTYDIQANRYRVDENGIVYLMDLEETRLLKYYFKCNERGYIRDWYNGLD